MSEYFHGDMYLQILKHLPLNSILRFRTVCKSWNSLITSNHFISTNLKHTKSVNQNQLLIRYFDRTHKTEQYIVSKDNESFDLQFSSIPFFQYASEVGCFRIVNYCDGVICLSNNLYESIYMVILWNPSIRKSIRVSIPKCEQILTIDMLGFGVCPVTHDPKIVKISYLNDFSRLVEVFSVALGVWRKPNIIDCMRNRLRETVEFIWSQVCYNGNIHWVAFDKEKSVSFCGLIVSFNLVDEAFDEISLPDGIPSQCVSNLSISIRKDDLALLEYDLEKGRESCDVWVMKEYGVKGSWEKLYVVRLPGILRKVVGFRMNGDTVVALKNHELVIVRCNGDVESLGIYGNIRSFFLGSYVDSLILINQVD
ncbi:F-box protein At3g07870-like [Rutidosis leptorrhynchoides]|uniref:F-box protein At3g07870-like n=1 Tax=Rutidosis leptorrhynchoides TaxID=125765 RepID=UPI003A9A2CC3